MLCSKGRSMATSTKRKPVIVMNTHVYPRYEGDHVAPFMHEFAKMCLSFARVIVHCPHAPGLSMSENLGGVEIRRFRYATVSKQTLAYRGDMHKQVFSSPFKALLFLKFLWKWRKATKKLIQQVQPDAIHAHWLIPGGYISSKAMKRSNIPLFISMHGTDVFLVQKRKPAQRIARKIFQKSQNNHFVSVALQESIESSCQRSKDSSDLILPMFFDFERFSNIVRKGNSKKILFVGRLLSVKGVDVLIEAFSNLKSTQNYDDWTLEIVGDGPLREDLQELTNSRNLSEHVTFHGTLDREELVGIYGECEIFVLPSRTTKSGEKEGLGVVLLEAMMSKIPVIGTNCGGIPEIIEHLETGLLIEQNDANALSQAIQDLIENDELRTQLVEKAHSQMREKYSKEAIELLLRQWYGGVLDD